ncbi:WD40-repeat-containing domain protein [Triangularia verruculosa]|uniref:WD40-repeat-containing domain protein n=1 Tax=Triangularia verruculosa TaxID=2587418 RepID=A0AAN6XC04_9PEZI|nr:WD40-repeat-containing domain protein [Triangularia verruculosa]
MYHLAAVDGYKYSSPETYVLEILPIATGLAATASDQTLSLFDPTRLNAGPLKQIRTNHGNLTCAKVYDPVESIVCTAGENGTVSIWDFRTNPIKAAMQIGGNNDRVPIFSLATSNSSNSLAAGTELANHQASILLWDLRSPSSLKIQYNEIHSDDITELTFHPIQPNLLLSGSTDGLLSISDTLITDEDELVITTFNHGSIHHAGFLNQGTELYAASHDEKFALYDMSDETPEQGSALLDMGDIREVMGCQYLANVVPKLGNAGAVVGVGSQDQEMFQLVHLAKGASGQWGLDRDTIVGLPGAHGQELVRSFVFYDEQQLVVTGGEDGCIKSWRPT